MEDNIKDILKGLDLDKLKVNKYPDNTVKIDDSYKELFEGKDIKCSKCNRILNTKWMHMSCPDSTCPMFNKTIF